MFSTLLRSSAAFFFPYHGSEELASRLQPGQQIQAELEQAAEQGMVSTRSHDNTPAGASHPSKQLYPQVVVFEGKRKVDNGSEELPAQVMTKRRRRSAKSNGVAAPSSSNADMPGRPRGRASINFGNGHVTNALNHSDADQDPSKQGSRLISPRMPGTTTDQTIGNGEQKKAIGTAALKNANQILRLDDKVLDAYDQAKPDASSPTRSRKGKTPKKRMRDLEGSNSTGVHRNRANVGAPEKKPDVLYATAAKATHTRFGSEDIEAPGTVPSTSIEEREKSKEGLLGNESESGDEAPETVTASAGFDKARTAAREAAKIAARYVSLPQFLVIGEKADFE